MIGMSGGPNGQWVRTSTTQNAKAFVAEKNSEAARLAERRRRSQAFRRRMWARVRSIFRRG